MHISLDQPKSLKKRSAPFFRHLSARANARLQSRIRHSFSDAKPPFRIWAYSLDDGALIGALYR